MRIASLQPSVTLTLAALGRLDALCAHTKYCIEAMPSLAERKLPIVADSWSTTTTELDVIRPDLVIASVPYRLESLAAILKAGVPVLALAPHSLEDVVQDTLLIARQVDRVQEAETLIADFRRALSSAKQVAGSLEKKRVYCEEWGKPRDPFPEMDRRADRNLWGIFLGTPGAQTTSEIVAEADPDLMIFAWCGAGDRVPLKRVVTQRNWHNLRAVRDRKVYCIPDEYLNTPAIPSLKQGLIHLGVAICPERFANADRLYHSITLTRTVEIHFYNAINHGSQTSSTLVSRNKSKRKARRQIKTLPVHQITRSLNHLKLESCNAILSSSVVESPPKFL